MLESLLVLADVSLNNNAVKQLQRGNLSFRT
jgi:hypothetical protein